MIGPLSRVPNAQKAPSYDEGRINADEGREQHQICGNNSNPLDTNNDFTPGVESQKSHVTVVSCSVRYWERISGGGFLNLPHF
jgi:hypothetical protein